MDLFNSTSDALYGDKLPPLDNSAINILSSSRALFYYTQNGKDCEAEVEIEVDYCSGEAQSHDCPGSPESAEITAVHGLSARELREWNVRMVIDEKTIEQELIGAFQYELQQQVEL